MRLPKIILIYIGTIVAPAVALMWLGIQSFERQREALATLTAEKLTIEIERRSRLAADAAFENHRHSIAKYFFVIDHGMVVQPALHAPPPRALPVEFSEAEREELDLNRPDLALDFYRKLFDAGKNPSLALSRMARCLSKLGRDAEARAVWRNLASRYPDERDLSNRPYGIVAAISAGDTTGLYAAIASGRWDLSADQAEYFLTRLDAKQSSRYLDQFRFARDLNDQFMPQSALRENEIYSYSFGGRRIFYRAGGQDRIEGFEVNADWIEHDLLPRTAAELGITQSAKQDQFVYGGVIALAFVILSAGVLLLLRDISREARTNQLRSDFVSSVSHELKTPITLIRLYSETLLRHVGFAEEQRADFQRIIMRESERLGRLVDQILTFSRVERGE
jgi:hypothetical protein